MPIKLKPKYDAAIECYRSAISVYFVRIPDRQIETDLASLSRENPGIEVEQEDWTDPVDDLPTAKVFHVNFPPVWNSEDVAIGILHCLRDEHGLSVRYIKSDEPPMRLITVPSA